MEFIRGIANLRPRHHGCVLTIGNYDGVHRGHRAVITELVEHSRALSCPATVMIFEPTPLEFFLGPGAPARLTTLREKLALLEASGVDRVLSVHFNRRLASMSPTDFVDGLLVDGLGARQVTVGEDFRFGHQRKGDFQLLSRLGEQRGFGVAATPEFRVGGERVSSSAVRAALAESDLARARELLGRDYSMAGRVRHGRQLGRELGFPTANIPPNRPVLPLHGVFAVRVAGAGDDLLPGVASLGSRPTVDGQEVLLEVHLFDVETDLYGRYLEVFFIERLREEQHFPDLESMVRQMHRDAARARDILAGRAGGS